MKKFLSLTGVVILLPFLSAPDAAAQGLGGFLKKAKTTVEQVTSILPTSAGTPVVLPNGAQVINPISDAIEIIPVGLYGVSTSENFGEVYLVVQVEVKRNVPNILLGCVRNDKMVALGTSGTLYNIDSSGGYRFDVIEGMPVTLKLDTKELRFLDVKKSDAAMSQVKLGVLVDNDHLGVVTFKNLPILWDQTPQ